MTQVSTRLDSRGLTQQREAFCQLVARGKAPTDAADEVYPDISSPASYGSVLMSTPTVVNRIETLEKQFILITELNRDALTVEAIETARHAREKEKFSASISGLRLAGDLQGLTTSNPVQEATAAFLGFLAGNSPNIEAIDVTDTEKES